MMPETMTTETVLNQVRRQFGGLDAKAEQAVTYALAILEEARASESRAPLHENGFASANVSLAQYDAWSPEERFQYLDRAKKSNALWLQKRFKELEAAWLMVMDGKVIAHAPTIQRLPQEREFDALCERHGKYPFVFFNPRLFLIEESFAQKGPFVAVNPNRPALVGRSLLFKTAPVVHLDFDARHTELEFKA